MESEPTSRALWGSGAGCFICDGFQNLLSGQRGASCLCGDPTYLLATVGQACRLFKYCRNLPPWHCSVLGSGAGCLNGVGTYLQGYVWQGCRLSKRHSYLSPGHCGEWVQAVLTMF